MNTPISPKLFLGIDTGGTYTDGVLLDPLTRRVVKTAKVRTTHHDLRECIAETLAELVPADPAAISLVSLSTTLATNAIVEGKRRPVALLLFGYDSELVYKFKFDGQFASSDFFFIDGLHSLEGYERIPLDEAAVLRVARQTLDRVDAYAVCAYGGPVNASHEQRAAELLRSITDQPVVESHHLSSELNSIRRATTASLNASLLGSTQDFLNAVEAMLADYQIVCPVMIVRGDGSLVRADFARKRPVEIVHSGPATSSIGAVFLARDALTHASDGRSRALVIDIGGTTTDLVLIDEGRPQVYEKASTVGSYQTCIRTIRARSFGLGGDSRIVFDHWGRLEIGPDRVFPLSYLCAAYPQARNDLLTALQGRRLSYSESLEFWLLRRPPDHPLQDALEQRIQAALAEGPLLHADLRARVGSIPPFVLQSLIHQEVVDRAALTPTDLLHVSGEYTPWDAEPVTRLVEVAGGLSGQTGLEFTRRVRSGMTRRMLEEIIQFVTGRQLSPAERVALSGAGGGLDRWLFEESLSPANPFLSSVITLKMPIIGIGAPAQAFLPPVAQSLASELILPENYAVANAVGAVAGGIVFQAEAEVMPYVQGMGIGGYLARVASDQRSFARYSDALVYARRVLAEHLERQAREAGAAEVTVEVSEREVWDGMAQFRGMAIGKLE